jgi:hypothetical protein
VEAGRKHLFRNRKCIVQFGAYFKIEIRRQ